MQIPLKPSQFRRGGVDGGGAGHGEALDLGGQAAPAGQRVCDYRSRGQKRTGGHAGERHQPHGQPVRPPQHEVVPVIAADEPGVELQRDVRLPEPERQQGDRGQVRGLPGGDQREHRRGYHDGHGKPECFQLACARQQGTARRDAVTVSEDGRHLERPRRCGDPEREHAERGRRDQCGAQADGPGSPPARGRHDPDQAEAYGGERAEQVHPQVPRLHGIHRGPPGRAAPAARYHLPG